MNRKAFWLIIRRQFRKKWGRFSLASLGVAVGVWSITLTTALSFGVSDTLVSAINSQPMAKVVFLMKFESGQTSFKDVLNDPLNIDISTISVSELEALERDVDHIEGIAPESSATGYFNKHSEDQKCFDLVFETDLENFQENDYCRYADINFTVFDYYYEENKDEWVGSFDKPGEGEVVLKLNGDVDLQSEFGVSNVHDLVDREVDFQIYELPRVYKDSELIDFGDEDSFVPKKASKETQEKYVVSAVVDNTKEKDLDNSSIDVYFDYSNLNGALSKAYPAISEGGRSFMQATVYVDDYNNLYDVTDDLKERGYLAFSPAELLIGGIQTVFKILSYVFVAFGIIALLASVFGIVNMMLISILERKKEIGILKSIGAKDKDIFRLFLLESSVVGVLGWVIGILTALGFGQLISFGFKVFIENNESMKNDLAELNINDFGLSFPWWIFVFTLVLAILFTTISGVWPAVKASKKDPVEVLRAE